MARPVRIGRRLYELRRQDGGASYYADVETNGRQERVKLEATNRTEARKAQADLISARGRGEHVTRNRVTLAEVAADLFETLESMAASGERSKRTLALYRQRWRSHLDHRLGNEQVQRITPPMIAKLLRELRDEGLAPWTRHGVLTLLGALFAHAVSRGYLAESPVRRLAKGERPKQRNREKVRKLTPDEVGKLIRGAWPTWEAFIVTAVYSGARVSEVLGLRWQDVDTTTGTLRLEYQLGRDGVLAQLKTAGSVRTIAMAPELRRVLLAHKLASPRSSDADFVFSTESGRPCSYESARRAFGAAVKRAQLADGDGRLSLHSLRHTAACALIASGADVVKVSRFLGHAKVSTTLDMYADEFAARQGSDMGSLLGEAFGGQS